MKKARLLLFALGALVVALACALPGNIGGEVVGEIEQTVQAQATELAAQLELTVAAPPTTAPPAVDLTGEYAIAGNQPDGTTYTGSAYVTPSGSGYDVFYVLQTPVGEESLNLLGTLDGDQFSLDNGLSVVVFTLVGDRVLEAAFDGTGKEVWTWVSLNTEPPAVSEIGDISGEYSVAGTNPDGSTYTGRAFITPAGGANNYDMRWVLGEAGQEFFASGTLTDNRLNVNGPEVSATYTFAGDGTATGDWTAPGLTGNGTEVLTFIGADGPGSSVERDISGEYSVFGTNQDGGNYSGTATITSLGGNQYQIDWVLGGGDQLITGEGTLTGNTFVTDDGSFAITYTLLPDGVLDGTWVEYGVNGEGTEILTPIEGSGPAPGGQVQDISGEYSVFGTNQDGGNYNGTATITAQGGNQFQVEWRIGQGSQSIFGVGTLTGNTFVVDDGQFNNTYTVKPDGVLDGVWIQYGVDGQGTEILTPVN